MFFILTAVEFEFDFDTQAEAPKQRLEYVCFDGMFYKTNVPFVTLDELPAQYGTIVETLWCRSDTPFRYDYHYRNMQHRLTALGIDDFNLPQASELLSRIKALAARNRYAGKFSVIEISLWMSATNHFHYIIKRTPHDTSPIEIPQKPFIISPLYDFQLNSTATSASGLQKESEFLTQKKPDNIDDFLLFNAAKRAIRTIGGNLFIFKNYDLTYVSTKAGSAFSAMTPLILEAAQEMHLNIIQTDGIEYNQLLNARECIVDHLTLGPQVVIGIDEHRFSETKDAKSMVAYIRSRFAEE